VSATIGKVVLHELLTVQAHKTITSLIDLRIISGAGLTELLDTELEEVLVGSLVVVGTEGSLEIRIFAEVELKVEDFRAGTALLDTILMPVLVELGIVVVESILKIRILVVIEVGIEDQVLRVASDGGVGDSAEAHGSHETTAVTLVDEVPDHLTRREGVEPWVNSLVDLRVIERAGLTELVDTELEVVLVGSLVVVGTEGSLEIRVLAEVELEIKNGRAGTALLDTILMPVLVELGIIVVESSLKIRILVVIEIGIEDDLLHVHGGIGGNTSQHHFCKGFIQLIKHLVGNSQ